MAVPPLYTGELYEKQWCTFLPVAPYLSKMASQGRLSLLNLWQYKKLCSVSLPLTSLLSIFLLTHERLLTG